MTLQTYCEVIKMEKSEVVKMLTFISNAYPGKFDYPTGKQDDEVLERTWYMYMKDYPADLVKAAVQSMVVEKPDWPPTVGELVQKINELQESETDKMTGDEAFALVMKKIKRHGSKWGKQNIREELPSRVMKAVEIYGGLERMGYGIHDGNRSFERKRFVEIYENLKEREEKDKMLPPSQREDVKQIADKFSGKDNMLQPGEEGE